MSNKSLIEEVSFVLRNVEELNAYNGLEVPEEIIELAKKWQNKDVVKISKLSDALGSMFLNEILKLKIKAKFDEK